MRHFLLALLLLTLCATSGMAQVNLREGIVITLSGDTLHGSIDYRTDRMNMEQCYFIPEGKTEAILYGAKDIAAYRFLDNGRYYVSKSIHDEEQKCDTTLFLEFVLRGQMNLYYLADSQYNRVYFIEKEAGQLARFQVLKPGETSQERHKKLKEALFLTADSPSTQEMLWEKCYDGRNVTKTFLHYNQEVCPDGECEVFEYKAKKMPKSERYIFPSIKFGYDYYHLSNVFGYDDAVTVTTPGFNCSVGLDFYLLRLSKGLFLEANATYHKYHFEKTDQQIGYAREWWQDLNLRFGVGYQWKKYRFQPRIYGGYSITLPWARAKYYDDDKEIDTSYRALLISHGKYVGIGSVYPLHRGAVMFNCEYNWTQTNPPLYLGTSDDAILFRRLSLSIGYQFGYGTKR